MSSVKKISFLDFWKGFNPNNNFLIHLFRSVYSNIQIVEPNNADIIVFSCFGNKNRRFTNKKKIFFTGENKRPDYNNCDYSISFDFDDHGGKNIRIPLWYYYIDWFGVGSYNNPDYLIPVEYLHGENEFTRKQKTKFCSAVYSNPIGLRNEFVNKLKNVDCYGKVKGFTELKDGEKYKLDIISDYKFNICFENSIYPGYYTEKILHAKIAGCIPIYYSDKKMNIDFNEKCALNLYDFENMEDLINKIIEIDKDEELYKNIYNENLFNTDVNLDNIRNKIKNIL